MTTELTPTALKPQPKRILGLSYTEIGILSVLLCVGCILVGAIFRTFVIRNSPASEPQVIQQKSRPNYQQMLENNGFSYSMNDADGDPIYSSPCGCVVTVKSDYVGFAAYYDPNNDCPIKDLGAIVSTMYPSEVFDYILSNMNSVIVNDTTVHGTAAGYDIKIDFDPYNPKLVIVIKEPR